MEEYDPDEVVVMFNGIEIKGFLVDDPVEIDVGRTRARVVSYDDYIEDGRHPWDVSGNTAVVPSDAHYPEIGARACTRYSPCGKHDCTLCYPGQGLPPDQWGRKKRKAGELGYRVVSYDEYIERPLEERPGEVFTTPDMAQSTARKRAKAESCYYLVLRDGVRWVTFRPDGSSEQH